MAKSSWIYSDNNWAIYKGAIHYWIKGNLYEAIQDENGKYIVSSEYENVIFNDIPTDMFEFIDKEDEQMKPALEISCIECGKRAEVKPGEHWICTDCKKLAETKA